MMGRLAAGQERLFYHFRLEDQVPANLCCASWMRCSTSAWSGKQLEPFYSEMGRPSVDPELMNVDVLLIGYCYSIRSERRLCARSGSTSPTGGSAGWASKRSVPQHSTFSVNRHGRLREGDALRRVFESVVARCMKGGLVGGAGFAVAASVVEAAASRYQRVAGSDVDWSAAHKAIHTAECRCEARLHRRQSVLQTI